MLFYITVLLNSCGNAEKETSNEPEREIITIRDQGVMCGEALTDLEWYLGQSKAPKFDGLDAVDYPITTKQAEAQYYFNQGMALAYGFNHAEAARSFYEATRIDSTCAMCYWGFAYVLGPNYNAGMEADNYERAYDAILSAQKYAELATRKEQDMIAAMSERYAPSPPEDRSELDQSYSNAMMELTERYPNDPELACLYAESLMNLHPWDLYTFDGEIKEWTPAILNSLNRVLSIDSNHIGAHHFYIHAVEASNRPQDGYASAAKFDAGLIPGSGHLVHMPSHIYIRTGDYNKGLQANIKAVAIDSNYVDQCHAQGAYPLFYFPHNIHFISATAMFAGNEYWAVKGANSLSLHVHRQLIKEPGFGTLQHYYSFPYYTAVKFGRWDDILNMNNFDPTMKYPEAIRHFARGMAFLGKSDLDEAKNEYRRLHQYAQDESLKEVTIWDINNVYTLLQIADHVLLAEILAYEQDFEKSLNHLAEAASLEDGLQYQEPTDWLLPVRHHWGAILLAAERAEDAINIYNQDLIKLPKNGWSLKGLSNAYNKLGDLSKAKELEDAFSQAWSHADIEIKSSRIL